MVLQAKKNPAVLLLLMGMAIAIFSVILWDFIQAGIYTPRATGKRALMCLAASVPFSWLYLDLRRFRSIQLDDQGVHIELLSFNRKTSILPIFQKTLLLWEEINEVSSRAYEIKLHGENLTIHLNALYFHDGNEVFQLIERHRHTSNRFNKNREN
jgi:hypothetical protein